jgi:methylated-DNA-[protein]-cysteine S-methyltransferase
MALKNNFAKRVQDIVKRIPKGETLSYGQVAAIAGSPGAARAVGSIMRKNFDDSIPCHRVIGANGSLGGYNRGGIEVKRRLLLSEGVKLHD